tara:strand:+ start:26444 stop:26638 length:195 start_codon:yes stop_codon:yes gene_type:complete
MKIVGMLFFFILGAASFAFTMFSLADYADDRFFYAKISGGVALFSIAMLLILLWSTYSKSDSRD